jgi:PAS domain S-box-containing protein
MDNTKTTSDRESERRYQHQFEASRRAEKRAIQLLDFVPYPMVVFKLDGRVSFVNSAFSEMFGWTLDELAGRHIPYVPPDLKEETGTVLKKPTREKFIRRFETKRVTKDGRVLDVAVRVTTFLEGAADDDGELVILRDLTREKRAARNNEVLLRISTALPAYPELEKLLDYISDEIRVVMNTEVALVILLDEERNEFSYVGVAHDSTATEKRIREFRFPADRSIAGKVVRTGQPIIVSDTSKEPDFYPGVDQKIGYITRNMLEVPLRGRDRIVGVLCARNKREGQFDRTDVELLTMIAGTVALFIENARVSEQLRKAYREVTSSNKAKEKAINHLSHELKTPLSVLKASLSFLEKKMKALPEAVWQPGIERARRNLNRILDVQQQVEDIMQDRPYKSKGLLSLLLGECTDELEALAADETGEESAAGRIRRRIEEKFGGKGDVISEIDAAGFLRQRIKALKARFAHRQVEIVTDLEEGMPFIRIPSDVLQKVVDGLIRNAVENTPDEGKIEIKVKKRGNGIEWLVHDYGVGITAENQRHIFEGFFVTRDTMAYSSQRPFDFNAGGKGADLLRMKIFSERHNFEINMTSSRCRFIPADSDICPGKISRCSFCKGKEVCYHSGGTVFALFFPCKT